MDARTMYEYIIDESGSGEEFITHISQTTLTSLLPESTSTSGLLTKIISAATEKSVNAVTSSVDTFGGSDHKLICTAAEIQTTQCLNGGECFALKSLGGSRDTFCLCMNGWSGTRCHEQFIDLSILETTSAYMTSSVVTALIFLCVALLISLLILIVCLMRQRQKNNSFNMNLNKKHPLCQQISYSNYHGIRVGNAGKLELHPGDLSPLNSESAPIGFSSFVNQAQKLNDENSDYGSNKGDESTPLSCNNDDEASKVDERTTIAVKSDAIV